MSEVHAKLMDSKHLERSLPRLDTQQQMIVPVAGV